MCSWPSRNRGCLQVSLRSVKPWQSIRETIGPPSSRHRRGRHSQNVFPESSGTKHRLIARPPKTDPTDLCQLFQAASTLIKRKGSRWAGRRKQSGADSCAGNDCPGRSKRCLLETLANEKKATLFSLIHIENSLNYYLFRLNTKVRALVRKPPRVPHAAVTTDVPHQLVS